MSLPTMKQGATHTRPQVGDWAWHHDGLDPRRVTKVSRDGRTISIALFDSDLGGLDASNYTYTSDEED